MHLSDIMDAAQFKVQGGSNYLWNCYGKNAHFMDFGLTENSAANVSCVFDTENQEVYEVTVSTEEGKMYRWINPKYFDVWKAECVSRKIEEELDYIDVDVEDDILDKAFEVIEHGVCDSLVTMEIKLEQDVIYKVAMHAHENDITFNELVNIILKATIDAIKEEVAKKPQ